VYTLTEHRRKGYAKIAVLVLMKEMMEAGLTPQLEIDTENPEVTAVLKMYTELGFVESCSVIRKQY